MEWYCSYIYLSSLLLALTSKFHFTKMLITQYILRNVEDWTRHKLKTSLWLCSHFRVAMPSLVPGQEFDIRNKFLFVFAKSRPWVIGLRYKLVVLCENLYTHAMQYCRLHVRMLRESAAVRLLVTCMWFELIFDPDAKHWWHVQTCITGIPDLTRRISDHHISLRSNWVR